VSPFFSKKQTMASIRKSKKALKKSLEKMTGALVVFSQPKLQFPLGILSENGTPDPDGKYKWDVTGTYTASIDPYKDNLAAHEIYVAKYIDGKTFRI
jgi:hypothetical protein